MRMDIIVNEELKAYIDPLTPDEHDALERSLLAEGCRDALVLWGSVLVDGHNRHAICTKHGIAFRTVQNTVFRSMDDVRLWMIDNHLGRRSISDYQRGVLALRKKDILQARAAAAPAAEDASAPTGNAPPEQARPVLATREAVARAARLSTTAVGQIEKIRKAAAPELVAAVKSGAISISSAAAVASLPAGEQAVAVAGGKQELRRAAREVRAKKAKPRPEDDAAGEEAQADLPPESTDVDELQRLVRALRAENADLKRRVANLTVALKEARGGL